MATRPPLSHASPAYPSHVHTVDNSQQHLWTSSRQDLAQQMFEENGYHYRTPKGTPDDITPIPETPGPRVLLTRPTQETVSNEALSPRAAERGRLKFVLLPAILICVPMVLLVAMLLALVYAFKVDTHQDVFNSTWLSPDKYDSWYVLVNYSATRLVFAASFLSTMAPLLSSVVMTLWTIIVSAKIRLASDESRFENLPTPYQLSLLIGVCLASYEQLRLYLCYLLSSHRRSRLPRIVNQTALVFIMVLCLAGSVFVADTALHYTTDTIEYTTVTSSGVPTSDFGRGLSPYCLNFDRVKSNRGFPCSVPYVVPSPPDYFVRTREVSRIQNNISTDSQIAFTSLPETITGDLALLLPQSAKVAKNMDYRASTIGISTQCQLLPIQQCDIHQIDAKNAYTQFNCSPSFYGVLGLPPVPVGSVDTSKPNDSNVSPLAWKPAMNINWMFAQDANLTKIYNSQSYLSASNRPGPGVPMLNDSQLINPFYLGFASRSTVSSLTATNKMVNDTAHVFTMPNTYIDYVMSCSISSYDVQYTWYQNQIQDVKYSLSPNGSVLDIFHGAQLYFTASGAASDIQTYVAMAAATSTDAASFLHSWSNSYSSKVLAQIGGWSTPRTSVQEQLRVPILVARVHKAVLGLLVGLSLTYTLLGLVLVMAAYRACTIEVKIIADSMSLAGLTRTAFGETKASTPSSTDSNRTLTTKDYFDTPNSQQRRVRLSGTEFRVWV